LRRVQSRLLGTTRANDGGLIRRLRLPILGVILVFAYGTAGYMFLGFRFIDALYMTALALTTAGFNPVGNLDPTEKAFTITIAIFGVSLFLVLLAVMTSAITEGRIGVVARRRRMERRIEALNDHHIVCAYGRVGRAAAGELASESMPFVVIDSKGELEDDMQRDGVLYIIGNPASEQILRKAGVERARGLICAVDDDSANVFITVISRSLNPGIFIVARASAPDTPDVLYKAGADRVVSPYVSSGGHMGRLALRPRVLDYMEVRGPDQERLRLVEILVDEGSPLVGQSVEKACDSAIPLLLRRASGEVIATPDPETTVANGDLLLVLGEPTELRAVEG